MKTSRRRSSASTLLDARLRMTVFRLVRADASGPVAVAAVVIIMYLLTRQALA